MKIFKELSKKGYKHYLPYTIDELDNLDIESNEIIAETALVLNWLYKKVGIQIFLEYNYYDGFHYGCIFVKDNGDYGKIWIENYEDINMSNTPQSAYFDTLKYILTNELHTN